MEKWSKDVTIRESNSFWQYFWKNVLNLIFFFNETRKKCFFEDAWCFWRFCQFDMKCSSYGYADR